MEQLPRPILPARSRVGSGRSNLLVLLAGLLLASFTAPGAAERDECRGPLVKLRVTAQLSHRPRPLGVEAVRDTWGVLAPFGRQLQLNETLNATLMIASPIDACSELQGDFTGSVVLVQRGTCSFTDKARRLQQAQAQGMLVFDNQPGCISMGYENGSVIEDLLLTSVSISQESGQYLTSLLQPPSPPALPPLISIQPVEVDGLDGSALVLWLLAVGTLVGGSLWAGRDYLLSISPGHSTAEVSLLQGPVSADAVVDISPQVAVGFIVMASCMLLLLFFFLSKAFFYVLLVLFSFASIQALTVTLAALLRLALPRLTTHMTTLPHLGPCPSVALLSAPCACVLVVVWAVLRDAPWSWVLQDVQGISLMLLIFRTLRLSSIKVATLLLCLAFVYDVFWVFIQPWLFNSQSVMVQVAEGGGSHENLPMLLRVPYLGLPRDLGGYSLLGFGDIILPGLLVAYMRRVDLDLHLHPLYGYFVPSCTAYGAGLVLTYIALLNSWFGDQGQPALLYLVPCTLGTVLLLGYSRGDLSMLWLGKTQRYLAVDSEEEAGEGQKQQQQQQEVDVERAAAAGNAEGEASVAEGRGRSHRPGACDE